MALFINGQVCPECSRMGIDPKQHQVQISIEDEFDFFKAHCSNGHSFLAHSTSLRYGFLFEKSIRLYQNNQHQESFLYLYSSLEQFWKEFSSAYFCVLQDVPFSETKKHFTSSKFLKQSERRYGAFLSCYMMFFGHPIEEGSTLSSRQINKIEEIRQKRNGIFHNGEFINSEKLEEYILTVFRYINTLEIYFSRETDTNKRVQVLSEYAQLKSLELQVQNFDILKDATLIPTVTIWYPLALGSFKNSIDLSTEKSTPLKTLDQLLKNYDLFE